MAGRLKNVLATYNEAEDLLILVAYKKGSNKNIDYAISKIDAVNAFLMQQTDEKYSFEEELKCFLIFSAIMIHLRKQSNYGKIYI